MYDKSVEVDQSIIDKIDSLPPLPKTVIEIEEFRQKKSKELDDLLDIINKDALLVATLLKVSNSAIFCFKSKIETVRKAVNLLGIEFTISIAMSSALQNILKTNLLPYGIHSNDFMRASNLSSRLAQLWLKGEVRNELVLPAFLQETGMFILAEIIDERGQTNDFVKALQTGNRTEIELQYTGLTSTKLTSLIFQKWKLCSYMSHVIACVDDIAHCNVAYLKYTQTLNVLKTICEVTDPLSEENIEKGLIKASEFNLDVDSLKKAIVKLQDNLLEEDD